jgi:8-oxo-dGTP pyrophosphatase MutT (NUDIX family)
MSGGGSEARTVHDPDGYRRRSARVLLLDSVGRILLLRFLFDSTDAGRGHGWVTPGGGVNAGEPLPHAAAESPLAAAGRTRHDCALSAEAA